VRIFKGLRIKDMGQPGSATGVKSQSATGVKSQNSTFC
jgi:hypothetical protein